MDTLVIDAKLLSPSQRREVPFRALARGEGTKSVRLFTPGKRKASPKSQVPGVWAAMADQRMVVISGLKNMADYQE